MKHINLTRWMALAIAIHSANPGLGAPLPEVTPLQHAHAHNDYEHTRPLLDALAQGFCSVEADVYLVEGKLLVAHDLKDTKPDRTLERLYLEPLRDRARLNGGRVYRGGPSVTLLVDVKSEASATYAALDSVLREFSDLLTRFSPQRIETNAVTVVVSGNRAVEAMSRQTERYAALDGRLTDLDGKQSPGLIPLISDNWTSHFNWRGNGELAPAEGDKLKRLVERAHRQDRRIRFWGIPDDANAWRILLGAGVDLINTDKLVDLRSFLMGSKVP